eukprot:m.122347 g.122347  ORF g.122347 m.122347 type:complete len:115 (-) comp13728_c1_seq5:124-468(-)
MQLQDKVPPSIIRALQSPGAPGDASRSPSNVTNIVIGNNKVALRAAETKAVALGFTTRIISSTLSGEVSDVASSLFDTIRAMAQSYVEDILQPHATNTCSSTPFVSFVPICLPL